MKDGEKVGDYISRLLTLTDQMKRCNESLNEVDIIEKILRTLSPFFDHIMVTIEETKDLDNMKMKDLQSTLKAHEMKVVERETEKQDEQALLAKFKKLDASKERCEKTKERSPRMVKTTLKHQARMVEGLSRTKVKK